MISSEKEPDRVIHNKNHSGRRRSGFYYVQLLEFRKDYLLTVETSIWQDWYKDVFNNIILTYDNLPDCTNLNIKVKNNKVVYTFPLENGYKTDLSNLERDMFSGVDREIKI